MSGMSHSSKMDVEFVPTLPTDPRNEKLVREPPRSVSDELTDARKDSTDEDVSTGQFVNANPQSLEPTIPSLTDSDVSSVDLTDNGEGWTEVDTAEVPAMGSRKEELGWETVALASAVAECDLAGEDEYSIETFRSSKKKDDLISKLGDEIEQAMVDIRCAETMAEHNKAAALRERMRTMVVARDELEAVMEE